jgi:hypothetical protein
LVDPILEAGSCAFTAELVRCEDEQTTVSVLPICTVADRVGAMRLALFAARCRAAAVQGYFCEVAQPQTMRCQAVGGSRFREPYVCTPDPQCSSEGPRSAWSSKLELDISQQLYMTAVMSVQYDDERRYTPRAQFVYVVDLAFLEGGTKGSCSARIC